MGCSRYNLSIFSLGQLYSMALPEIVNKKVIAQTGAFIVEALDLRFSNGVERKYQRLRKGGREAVIIVALSDNDEIMLVREYCAGFHEVRLSLPKGTVDLGETLEDAARRELSEEIGYSAKSVNVVKELSLAPSHMGFTIHVIFATDLYPNELEGDEPEPLELVRWPVEGLPDLIESTEFSEARAIAALTLCKPFIN